jgi:hypothetical protein
LAGLSVFVRAKLFYRLLLKNSCMLHCQITAGTAHCKALHQTLHAICVGPGSRHLYALTYIRLLLMQAVAGKSRTGRRLMADNAALLNDLAELQHSNRDLARQLAAATDQLAHFTGVQFAASNGSGNHADVHTADAADAAAAAATAESGFGAAGSRPASAAPAQGRPGSAGYVPAFLTADGSRPASPG